MAFNPKPDRDTVRFGKFVLDLVDRRLNFSGQPVKLSSRALDILCELASVPGEVVSKDRLMEKIWAGRVVEENAIQVHVSALRKALELGSAGHSYVVTVPGRGYRLVGVENRPDTLPYSNSGDIPARGTTVAVLRFANLSGDSSQDYFADGIVEDIITGLSRITGLSVVGSTSSLLFEAGSGDLASIGRKLGCRYLVQGSVRKAANRIRITARLVESDTGVALWAERYDRRSDDIFEVQDAIAMSLIGALEPNLRKVEISRVRRERPNSLDAYDLVLRALSSMRTTMPTGAGEAIPLLEKALELEPDYSAAQAQLARCFQIRFSRGGLNEADRAAAVHYARAATRSDDATALGAAGLVIWFADPDFSDAFEVFHRALSISPSNVVALGNSAFSHAFMGDGESALKLAQHALEVSPFDTLIAHMAIAVTELYANRFDEALKAAVRAVEANPSFSVPHVLQTIALVRLGRIEEARSAAERVLNLDPTFTMPVWSVTVRKNPAVFDPMAQAWSELATCS
ncbi:winged helix-turn-helix domain-containing protein [Bradyrhizobium diazoefficiens]|nr:winged helix-turn-helix domain-containing protein [Bradyrhizobium diazoefficiens]MBR0703798.1 winged helix-turn-helix domain-containing protein [Bradyrhizobium diazoefficiens]MBR0772554.1 winged helix-turn-helix domain-containing protein [Bradyrhizobium diazoefficiens]